MTVKVEKFKGKTYLTIEGVVTGLFFNKLKELKTYPNPRGGQGWTPTHSINMIVDNERVSMGLTDREGLRAKDNDGNYQDVVVGTKINVTVEENGEYKGVKQYQSKPANIVVFEVATQKSKVETTSTYKRDDLPIRLGNAITAASNMYIALGEHPVKFEEVMNRSKQIIPVVDKLRTQLKERYPQMDDYSLGARLGQCVVIATAQGYIDDINALNDYVPDMFDDICQVEEEIRHPENNNSYGDSMESTPDYFDDDIPF